VPVNLGMRAAGRLAVALNAMLGSRAKGRLGILTYHRIASHVDGLPAPLHNVEPHRFSAQLHELSRRGFQFVSLNAALSAAHQRQSLPPKSVVLTFDDGFATVYTHAWPLLERLQIPATVFINTAYIDSDDPFPFDAWGRAYHDRAPLDTYRPLTTAECREMSESGLIAIGAHTHTHQDHRGCPEAFREDLQKSVEIVRERFRESDVTFAFPYGCVHAGFANADAIEAAGTTGVRCGLTTTAALVDTKDSPFRWGRFNVFAWDTGATLTAKLGGWYGWAPRTKQAVARTLRFKAGGCLAETLADSVLSGEQIP